VAVRPNDWINWLAHPAGRHYRIDFGREAELLN